MPETRTQELIARLERGQRKTTEAFRRLTAAQWETAVYRDPATWTPRNLLAHFLSSERELLRLCRNVAEGGPGVPEAFDFDAYNAEQQMLLQDLGAVELIDQLEAARTQTLEWARGLEDGQLDLVGRHPALGEISLETMILAIYGHQLMHMRDLQGALGPPAASG